MSCMMQPGSRHGGRHSTGPNVPTAHPCAASISVGASTFHHRYHDGISGQTRYIPLQDIDFWSTVAAIELRFGDFLIFFFASDKPQRSGHPGLLEIHASNVNCECQQFASVAAAGGRAGPPSAQGRRSSCLELPPRARRKPSKSISRAGTERAFERGEEKSLRNRPQLS